MKAAQVGATEAGNNWMGFCINRAPGPFRAVQPTVAPAKRLSEQRLDRRSSFRRDRSPWRAGVKDLDIARDGKRVRTQVCLKEGSILTDDERHHAGPARFCRKRKDRVARHHVAVDLVVYRPARRGRSLTRQDTIIADLLEDRDRANLFRVYPTQG